MKRRYRNQPPPDDAECIVGEGYEFKPEHDLVNAGKPLPPPVELTPVGPPATIYEFHPGDDRVPRSVHGTAPELAKELRAAIEELILKLNPSQRAIIECYFCEKWEPSEVARAAGVSETQVYTARKQLLRQLGQLLARFGTNAPGMAPPPSQPDHDSSGPESDQSPD